MVFLDQRFNTFIPHHVLYGPPLTIVHEECSRLATQYPRHKSRGRLGRKLRDLEPHNQFTTVKSGMKSRLPERCDGVECIFRVSVSRAEVLKVRMHPVRSGAIEDPAVYLKTRLF